MNWIDYTIIISVAGMFGTLSIFTIIESRKNHTNKTSKEEVK